MQDTNTKIKTFTSNTKLISKNLKFLDNSNAIFKFSPFTSNYLKIIINSELWFGEPENQNDPYEGEFVIKNTSNTIKKETIDKIVKELGENNIEHQIEDLYSNSVYHPDLIRAYQESLKSKIKYHYGICSFTKTYNDILL